MEDVSDQRLLLSCSRLLSRLGAYHGVSCVKGAPGIQKGDAAMEFGVASKLWIVGDQYQASGNLKPRRKLEALYLCLRNKLSCSHVTTGRIGHHWQLQGFLSPADRFTQLAAIPRPRDQPRAECFPSAHQRPLYKRKA